jgi:alkyl hydroperoxide reductase subunit AhpC
VCRALGVYHEAGMPQRALILVGPDGVVQWSWMGENPGVLPGANLIFDALAA